MAEGRSRRSQFVVYLNRDKRDRAVKLAKDEHDRIGSGLSVVVRRAIDDYLRRNEPGPDQSPMP